MFFDDTLLDILARGLLLSAAAMIWVVALVRIVGLRAFSKMTAFDFVMTVATGSLLAGASQATEWRGFGQALVAIAGLFLVQYLTARIRKASDKAEKLIQNEPVILMWEGQLDEKALKRTRVSKSDIYAKLREANAMNLRKVRAVVLETTGDVSVLHGPNEPDEALFFGVRNQRGRAVIR